MCAKHIPNTLISDEYHMCVSLYVIRANSNLLNINYSGMLDTQEMCWGFFNLMSKVTGETEHLLIVVCVQALSDDIFKVQDLYFGIDIRFPKVNPVFELV